MTADLPNQKPDSCLPAALGWYYQRMKTLARTWRGPRRLQATLALLVASIIGLPFLTSSALAAGDAVVLQIDGAIGAATADYVISGIEYAEEADA